MAIEEWARAARARDSRRRFTGEPVAAGTLDALADHCDGFRPFQGARVALAREPLPSFFAGLRGGYSSFRGWTAMLVMIGDTAVDDVPPSVGYTGEAAVLEAVRLGLGTCWVAGLISQRKVRGMVELSPTEKAFAVSPLGYAAEPGDGSPPSYARKELSTLAPGVATGKWPDWAFEGLTLARVAPSAVNRQPWRFRLDGDGVVVSVDPKAREYGISPRLDCGIAMLQFELGALMSGGVGGWKILPEPDVARYALLPTEGGPQDGLA